LTVVGRPSKSAPWVRFEIHKKQNLGVFVLDECTNNELYRDTLHRFFAEVREAKITRIAVDVRRNGGGDSSVLREFLQHLDVESYTHFGSLTRWSPEARAQVGGLARFAWGTRRIGQRRVQNSRVEKPFCGDVFIVTSKATFSSANWFAVIVQDNKIGKVLGEPTGNAPTSFGDQLRFELTHSGLSYRLSFKLWIRPDPKRDPADTLAPDCVIPTTARDLVDGRDAVLDFLRNVR
jgi:C-terminal processing protease CtpA/Prc